MRSVLITGAARGIGRAIADRYRVHGWTVLAPPREEMDLSSDESIRAWLDATRPDVDVLVNNAGENRVSPLESVRLGDWRRGLEVNVTAPLLLIQALVPAMRRRRWGRIVNIGSCYSLVSRAGRATYTAGKTALLGLTRTGALEFAADNVLVNLVCPGFIETDLTRRNNTPEQIATLVAQIPLGRLGQAEEVARLVYFLGSEENTLITGQAVVADGGFLCQ